VQASRAHVRAAEAESHNPGYWRRDAEREAMTREHEHTRFA
jgi:hypothetical protein